MIDCQISRVLPDNYFSKSIYLKFKIFIDFIISILFIVILSPLFIIITLLIKILSPGPILFKQKRIGYMGKEFTMYKFRTMKSTNNKDGACFIPECINRKLIKLKNDKRVTLFGKILRLLSIDELLQLFNVLKGDMSLVGPRPLIKDMLVPYKDIAVIRSIVKPGITSLWQIKAREKNTSVTDMIYYDVEYINKQSIKLDFAILFLTIPKIMSGKGAY